MDLARELFPQRGTRFGGEDLAVGWPAPHPLHEDRRQFVARDRGPRIRFVHDDLERTFSHPLDRTEEKDRDQYVLDESETHDRPLAPVEVDAAINDYINSVKARAPKP